MTNSYLLLTNKVVSCKNNLQVCEITKGSALYLLFVCVRAFLSGDELQKTISLMDDKKVGEREIPKDTCAHRNDMS